MTVKLTINGVQVSAPDGSTILEAARQAGIRIPTLCHHPNLSNVGACRMCVVSVERARGLQTACTTPVFEGMVVDTESKEARATRQFVLEMLLSDHPNECMKCEANSDCELQDLVYEYDVPWPTGQCQRHSYPINPDPNPFIFIDRNKCILCTRCVRACDERPNRAVWNIAKRGFGSKLVAGADQNMFDAGCEFCGACVQVCPTGALWPKKSLGKGRSYQTGKVRTTCPYCGVGCQLELRVKGDQIVRVNGVDGAQPNQGLTCVKGRFGYDFIYSQDRLTTPLIREGDGFREASWDEALDLVASKFQQIIRESGPDAIAGVSCARSTNEDSYNMQKLFRAVIGTNNIDHCART
jgi:formate dehydrogenase major subunit